MSNSVAQSYVGRLRPRHHALARLAREGLAPALITTNYDLLLEGAYRLAGFVEREHAIDPDGTPCGQSPRFSTIASADQFFARGQGYRTALLLKIHGCAQVYRNVRTKRIDALVDAERQSRKVDTLEPDVWATYLPALVFTYREIQTWRSDAWSRDLVRTMLRTHTIALCGYSGADPVMHSTFREVYDERVSTRAATPPDTSARHASVFFFGLARRREFHSLEILRAATAAAGLDTGKLVEHPNHLEFEAVGGFPTLDDHFRWLSHFIVRDLQAEALETRLRRLLPRMLGRVQPLRDKHLETAYERFRQLRRLEAEAIAQVCPPAGAARPHTGEPEGKSLTAWRRREFDRIVGWTLALRALGPLREFALADTVEACQGAGRSVRTSRTSTYYYPVSERPEWSAWAVVVELALRTLVAALNDETTLMPANLVAEESPHAVISFRRDGEWKPLALCIRMAGFERQDRAARMTGAFHRVGYWELREQDVPWPMRKRELCPSPEAMWNWAMGEKLPTRRQAASYLGVSQ